MSLEDEYQETVALLTHRGLTWLVDQVEGDVRAGKFVLERRRTLKEAPGKKSSDFAAAPSSYSAGPTEEFTVAEPYAPEEKLELLLVAMRRVLVDPVLMHEEIFKRLGQDFAQISFVAEISNELLQIPKGVPPDRLELSRELLADIESRVRELQK